MQQHTKPLIWMIVLQALLNLALMSFILSTDKGHEQVASEFQPDLVTFNIEYGTVLVDEKSRFMLSQISIEEIEEN